MAYNLGRATGEVRITFDTSGIARADRDAEALEIRLERLSRQDPTVRIRVSYDSRGIQQTQQGIRDTQRQVDALGRSRATPHVDLLDADARARLLETRRQLAELERTVATARVNANTIEARANLAGLEVQLTRLRERVNVPINIQGTREAEAELLRLQASLRRINGQRATARVEVRGADEGLLTRLTRLRIGLIGLAAALSPALIPIVGGLSVSLLGLAGAAASAASGVGLVAGAWKTMSKSIMADPGVSEQMTGITNGWNKLSQSIKPQLLVATSAALEGVNQVLDQLQPIMTVAANAVKGLAQEWDNFAASQPMHAFINFLSRQAGPAITTFGHLALNAITGLMGIFRAFEPVIKPVEDALNRGGEAFARWGNTLSTNPQFQKFLDYVRATGPGVVRLLKDLWGAIGALVLALAPLGPPLISFIDNLVRLVQAIASNGGVHVAIGLIGQSIQGLSNFLASDWGRLTLIAIGIRAISAAVMANPWIATLGLAIGSFGWLYEHDPALATGLLGVAAAMWAVNYAGYGLVGVPIIGFLAALGVGIYEITQHWEGFKGAMISVQHFIGGFFAMVGGNFEHLGHNIKNWAKDAWNAIQGAFGDKGGATNPVGRFVNKIVDGLNRARHDIAQWVHDVGQWFGPDLFNGIGHFADVAFNWGKDLVTGLVHGITSNIKGMLGDIGHWFSDAIFGPIKSALGISSPSTVMFSIGTDLITGFFNGIIGFFGRLAQLNSIGGAILGWIESNLIPLVNNMIDAGIRLMTGLLSGVSTGTQAVINFFIGLPAMIGGFFVTAGTWLWNQGGQIIQSLVSGMQGFLGTVAGFLARLPGLIAGWLVGAGGWLFGHGSQAIGGLASGMASAVGWVAGFLAGLPGRIRGWLVGAGGWLLSHGSQALSGLRNGMSGAVGFVSGFLAGLPGRIRGWLAGAGGWFVSHGSQAMSGLRNGMSGAYGAVSGFVSSIPGRLRGMLGNLGGLLVGAGEALMHGLGAGIERAAQGVFNFVSGIAGKIARLKGPLDYDRTLLVPHGNAIMEGLLAGIQAGAGPMLSYIKQIAIKIADTMGQQKISAAAATLAQARANLNNYLTGGDGRISEDDPGWNSRTMGNHKGDLIYPEQDPRVRALEALVAQAEATQRSVMASVAASKAAAQMLPTTVTAVASPAQPVPAQRALPPIQQTLQYVGPTPNEVVAEGNRQLNWLLGE